MAGQHGRVGAARARGRRDRRRGHAHAPSVVRGKSEPEAAAWIFRIAANVHAKYLRRGQAEHRAMLRLGLATPDYSDADLTRVEELAGVRDLRARVASRFSQLPTKQRDAVSLRVVEDLSYPEVASRLGVSEQTARARVSRGLRRLRDALRPPNEEHAV